MATDSMNDKLMGLPLMKSFDESAIATKVDTFRKGEKNLFWFLKLGVFAAIAYAVWVYVLPPVLQAVGQMLGLAATAIMVVFFIIAAPVIIKGIRSFTRFLHKTLIKHDPFGELENQRMKLLQNQQIFRVAKGKIVALKQDMEIEAKNSEKDAEQGQTKILTLQGKAAKIKAEMDDMVAKQGVGAKGEDNYIQLASDFRKVNNDALIAVNKTNQSKDFIQKYGSRANVMKKLNQKLMMVETEMDIKISNFDATVEMLKKDYSFGQKANQATTAAKNAMMFQKGWELDYALEVVTSTIAADIAITSGNLKDIDSIASNFSMDSDELYANLEAVADKIKVGGDVIPSAKQYSNPEYKLTSDDKLKSGGFGDMEF